MSNEAVALGGFKGPGLQLCARDGRGSALAAGEGMPGAGLLTLLQL